MFMPTAAFPEAVKNDPVLYGECLGGALYWNDFLTLAKQAGFSDPRLVSDRPLEITDPELLPRAGGINFHSATWRLFKLAGLESACEDYGQAVIYRGSIAEHPHHFAFDKHHTMETAASSGLRQHLAACWPKRACASISSSSVI